MSFSSEIINKGDTIVYIYHIPDDDPSEEQTEEDIVVIPDIVSDDVTADTSGINYEDETEDINDDYFYDDENYQIGDMYSDVLKGYAVYNEEDEEGIALESPDTSVNVLNIKPPVIIKVQSYNGLQTSSLKFYDNKYSKYNIPEYSISPLSSSNSKKLGGFSAGTSYSQEVDYGELEQTSGVFSRYEYKRFALQTSYAKTINSTNNNYNDIFYISPEFRINQYLLLKQNFSADITKHRKKAEILLSINPFGKKDIDRFRVDFGASQTYDEVSETFKSQFRFATNLKL